MLQKPLQEARDSPSHPIILSTFLILSLGSTGKGSAAIDCSGGIRSTVWSLGLLFEVGLRGTGLDSAFQPSIFGRDALSPAAVFWFWEGSRVESQHPGQGGVRPQGWEVLSDGFLK